MKNVCCLKVILEKKLLFMVKMLEVQISIKLVNNDRSLLIILELLNVTLQGPPWAKRLQLESWVMLLISTVSNINEDPPSIENKFPMEFVLFLVSFKFWKTTLPLTCMLKSALKTKIAVKFA